MSSPASPDHLETGVFQRANRAVVPDVAGHQMCIRDSNMAAARYEQNEDFFVKMFSDPDMMRQVMETVGTVLYERLRGQKE